MFRLFFRLFVCKETNLASCHLCGLRPVLLGRKSSPFGKLLERRSLCSFKAKPKRTGPLENNETAVSVPEDVRRKVKYNSILSELSHKSWRYKKRVEGLENRARLADKSLDVPLSLKYAIASETEAETKQYPLHFPFSHKNGKMDYLTKFEACDESSEFDGQYSREDSNQVKDWMDDYEYFSGASETANHEHENEQWSYGTPDTRVPVSSIPCGGCGAFLQCQDSAIPGYLPSELLRYRTEPELRAMKCQRCHFLENYNVALNLSVQPDAYSVLLRHIKRKRALCVVVVDITDFPCSLWPGIMEIIGPKRPVIVVGNKVDLLPSDSRDFLSHVKKWLENMVYQSELAAARVKHVALVSAKTGFGMEELITRLQLTWKANGDVYLLGCTNVGKSTLFNSLVRSDYCKVQAVDLMQRATTSRWPGTTLSLLKFPIQRAKRHVLFERMQRLRLLKAQEHAEKELTRDRLRVLRDPLDATFIGHMGFTHRDTSNLTGAGDPFSMRPSATIQVKPKLGLNPDDEPFRESKWCYDTPGAVHPEQALHLLTSEELLLVLPRHMIIPRSFLLLPGDSLLVAGLGRIDFLSVDRPGRTRFTVFAAATLPITVCCTEHVDEVYSTLAAANMLRVPSARKERLAQWPSLAPTPEPLEVQGVHSRESAADILLSSAGWVAVTPERERKCLLRPWTPHGRGIHLRIPPLVRYAVNLRGPLVRSTPAYHQGRAVRL